MTYRRRLLAATVFISSLGLVLSGAPTGAYADQDDRMAKLERLIRLQQKKLEDQQRKIARQERRLRLIEETRRAKASTRKKDPGEYKVPSWLATIPWYELGKLRGGFGASGPLTVVLPDGRIVAIPPGAARDALLAQDAAPKPPVTLPPRPKKKPPRRRTTRKKTPPAKKPPAKPATRRPATPPATPAVARPKSEKQPDQLLLEAGAILLRPGTLQVEPGFEYQRFSVSNVAVAGLSIFDAIIIGTIRVDRLDRDILTASLRARYGIASRVQADFFLPFLYRRDLEVFGIGTPTSTQRAIDGYGVGDIEAGITWQALLGRGARPSILLRANGRFPTGRHAFEISTVELEDRPGEVRLSKPPTGSGFYGAGLTATLVWTVDPVAFFTGGGYVLNIKRSFTGVGSINPGDQYSFFAGMNVALSEKVSMNISFINQHTMSTRQNGASVPGTSFNDARLTLGASVALGKTWSLLVSAAGGLTDQSPDFAFSISVPITFNFEPIRFPGLNQ